MYFYLMENCKDLDYFIFYVIVLCNSYFIFYCMQFNIIYFIFFYLFITCINIFLVILRSRNCYALPRLLNKVVLTIRKEFPQFLCLVRISQSNIFAAIR